MINSKQIPCAVHAKEILKVRRNKSTLYLNKMYPVNDL